MCRLPVIGLVDLPYGGEIDGAQTAAHVGQINRRHLDALPPAQLGERDALVGRATRIEGDIGPSAFLGEDVGERAIEDRGASRRLVLGPA